MPQNSPEGYKLSRAAMRERYGARAIDASTKTSSLDSTPSGKLARLRETGMSEKKVADLYNQDWKAQFASSRTIEPNTPNLKSRAAIQNPQVPVPSVQPQQPQTLFGPDRVPYQPIGLLPPTAPAESFTPFTPAGPLNSFALQKPTVLSNGSKWNRPSFG